MKPAGMMQRGCTGLALVLAALVHAREAPDPGLSMAGEYWLALNEGRDVTAFEAIGRAAVTPENRLGTNEPFNRRRRRILDEIAQTEPRPEVRGGGRRADAIPGADCPLLGGNIASTDVAADRGPTRGEVLWRFPVGFDFKAGAAVQGDTVFVPSPGTETVLYALDRNTGTTKWIARREPSARRLPFNGGGSSILVGSEVSVAAIGFYGRIEEFMTVDQATGAVKNRASAQPLETSFLAPGGTPEPRRAFVADRGRAIAVKGLHSGRIWWKFPVAQVRNEPVEANGRVFATADDGGLWALNLEGAERVAWNVRIEAPWRTPITIAGNVVRGPGDEQQRLGDRARFH